MYSEQSVRQVKSASCRIDLSKGILRCVPKTSWGIEVRGAGAIRILLLISGT
jgi:hypothetical protein